jgi:hypothetical protein
VVVIDVPAAVGMHPLTPHDGGRAGFGPNTTVVWNEDPPMGLGITPGASAVARIEWLRIFAFVTAPSRSWRVPTLAAGITIAAAEVPPTAANRASNATAFVRTYRIKIYSSVCM